MRHACRSIVQLLSPERNNQAGTIVVNSVFEASSSCPFAISTSQDLVFMVTQIDEQPHGRFHLWGTTADGTSVLVHVTNFRPYFLMAAPALQVQP